MKRLGAIALVAVATTAPVSAQQRDYCPSRPGLGTTPCTIASGKVSVETALGDWERDDQVDTRRERFAIGDSVIRVGLADATEALVAFTPYTRVRASMDGVVDRASGFGDVMLGFKQNLARPDGDGLSFAVQPFATLPIGNRETGAGDWSVGVLAPVTFAISASVSLQFTPEIDAAVDQDRHGRHLAYGGIAGVDVKLAETVDLIAEFEAHADDDPGGHARERFAALSAAWMPRDDLQLDVGAVAGLNRDAADARIYAGVSRRF